jgi:hypothetical protein
MRNQNACRQDATPPTILTRMTTPHHPDKPLPDDNASVDTQTNSNTAHDINDVVYDDVNDDADGTELVPALDRDDALAERRLKAVWLWFQGLTTAEIAVKIGVGERQARKDLAQAREDWGANIKRKLAYELNKRLSQYDMLKAEFFAAWKASQIRSVRTGVTGDAEVMTQAGDPRYLNGYRECLDRECKLLGLDAPERIQVDAPVRLVAGVNLDAV